MKIVLKRSQRSSSIHFQSPFNSELASVESSGQIVKDRFVQFQGHLGRNFIFRLLFYNFFIRSFNFQLSTFTLRLLHQNCFIQLFRLGHQIILHQYFFVRTFALNPLRTEFSFAYSWKCISDELIEMLSPQLGLLYFWSHYIFPDWLSYHYCRCRDHLG